MSFSLSLANLLVIGLGGAVGALLRYQLCTMFLRVFPRNFPWPIMGVNLLGCFVMGLVMAFFLHKFVTTNQPSLWQHFITIGLLGSLTTFSTFAMDSYILLQQARWLALIFYIGLSVFGGLGVLICGWQIGRWMGWTS